MSATGEGAAERNAEAGFTVLEMLVVVGLLTLASLIIFADFSRPLLRLRTEATRDAVVDDLRGARASAVRRDQPVSFDISDDGSGYSLDGRARRLASGRLVGDPPRLVFDRDGEATEARLAVLDRRGRALPFSVDSQGLVHKEPPRDPSR